MFVISRLVMTNFDEVKRRIAQIGKYDKGDELIEVNGFKFEVYVEGDRLCFQHKHGNPSDYIEVKLDSDNTVKESVADDVANILFDWADSM